MLSNRPARIAIDLGAESCRVSLLRWIGERPRIELIHRIPNGPLHQGDELRWPFDLILAGLRRGLVKAAETAGEGVASIGVDGWAVDYVRLGSEGEPIGNPFCYRDERTIAAKALVDTLVDPAWAFRHSGAQPLRINTLYQVFADRSADIDPRTPWMNLPEYVLHWLGGNRVAEFTNATHTGMVDLVTGDWSEEIINRLGLPSESFPPLVPAGTVIGRVTGPLAQLPAFRDTQLIVPACHDTASAIAGISTSLENTAYIVSGTWSLVGTLIDKAITTEEARSAGFTNQGAAGDGFCFHTNVNGMWILKQCMECWRRAGAEWQISELISRAAECDCAGVIPVDSPSLLLDGNMPELLNDQLRDLGYPTIEDCPGNEPRFARMIFESLAARYACVVARLGDLLDTPIQRIHVLGGGSQNQLLTRLTAVHTGLPVDTGNVESSTIGNFAIQLAASERVGEQTLSRQTIVEWARILSS